MNAARLEEARESLCGWDHCIDCQMLREAIAEIERLRVYAARFRGDLARILQDQLGATLDDER